jgi:hypothetical protein
MPPLPRLRIPALDDLARQVRFEPPRAARRQIAFAESLAAEIDPDRTYPEDWVLFRLTGFRADDRAAGGAATADAPERGAPPRAEPRKRRRPRGAGASAESGSGPTLIVGAALLADLPGLVERLSVAARLSEQDLAPDPAWNEAERGPYWLDAGALCRRWRISRKTLDRYRRLGLLGRRIVGPDRRHRLVFSRDWIDRFERRHAERLRQAAAFTRIDRDLERRILRRAERYRRLLGCSLNQAAARLAARFGRSHEAVRQLLRRHAGAARRAERGDAAAVFDEPPPLHARERRLIERAVARGIDTPAIARRLRTTPACIYRSLVVRRYERLRALDLAGPRAAAFEAPDAPAAFLDAPAVRAGLGAGAPATLADLIEAAADGALSPPDAAVERARAGAYWFLRFDAARLLAAIPARAPSALAVDRVETRLRWAARLKAELVRSQVPLVLKSIEAGLRRPVTALPTAAAARIVRLAIDAAIDGVERFDPFRGGAVGGAGGGAAGGGVGGGRLAAPVGLAVSRAVTQWMRSEGAPWAGPVAGGPRASPRADPAAVVVDDWTRRVAPWQAWLEPDARVRPVVERLPAAEREVLAARLGWIGDPPVTAADLAAARGVTPAQVVRLERRAIRRALASARGLDAAGARHGAAGPAEGGPAGA